jgi:1,4-dihydroxy-2-naphthoate octaprenyltransferase
MPRIKEKLIRKHKQRIKRKWVLTVAIVGLILSLLLAIVFNSVLWLIGILFLGCIIGGVVIMDLWDLKY